MSTVEVFKVQIRPQTGGGASRLLRRSGMIPAILYGGEKENISLMVDPRDVEKGLHQSGFYSRIFELDVGDKKEQALVREVQFHPVTDRPVHMDFLRVRKDSKIHVAVPVHFLNENQCPGLKQGGILNIVLYDLDVTCAAGSIPAELTVDLTGLEIGAIIHTDVLQLPKGVVISHPDRDNTLATIVAPKISQGDEEVAEIEETATTEEPAAEASKES